MKNVLPTQACKIVQLWTGKKIISLSLSHLIHVEIEKGKIILAGYSNDIFSTTRDICGK